MKNIILFSIILGAVGLIVGYFIFGKIMGEYISIMRIIGISKGFGNQMVNAVMGIEKIRKNILLCGAGGVGLGFILGLISTKR